MKTSDLETVGVPGAPRRPRGGATSFAAFVDDYERGRPAYPPDAVDWLVRPPVGRVVDLGAGTGKLTMQIAGMQQHVVAIEALEPMVGRLGATAPHMPAVCARAEAIPLRDACADVVTVAQAFHWFEQGSAVPEIARILRPGGFLSLVWNFRDERVPWVADLTRLIGTEALDAGWSEALDAAPAFERVERRTFRLDHRLDRDGLLAWARSRSYVASLTDDDRAAVLEQVERLWRTHPDLGGASVVTVPFVTVAYRYRRWPGSRGEGRID